MAFNLRGRRVGYDNVASGSATGRERTILGSTPSTEPVLGGSGSSTDPGGSTSSAGARGVSRLSLTTEVMPTSDVADNYVVGSRTLRGERPGGL